jgi:RHS repeat-associated protein
MQEGNTSLFYLRLRYYDSAAGRFLSRDPLFSSDPREINPYQYADDNPVTRNDPSGLKPTYGAMSFNAAATSSDSIPRFCDKSTSGNIFAINICQTNLLFPFVTNQLGFDTGLAISNTTSDPFGTTQCGTCTLNFYGAGAPAGAGMSTGTIHTPSSGAIPAGGQFQNPILNFQYVPGLAFISGVGSQNPTTGYFQQAIEAH